MASPSFIDETLSLLPRRYRKAALPAFTAVVLVAITALAASYFYGSHIENRNQEVSEHYWRLNNAVEEGEVEAAGTHLAAIKDRGTDEQYSLAAMVMAAGAFASGEHNDAETLYREVIGLTGQKGLRDTARTRLAKVLLEKGELGLAKDELIQVESVGQHFAIVVSDLLGDIALAEGDLDEAESYYREGLDILTEDADEELTFLLNAKLAMVISLKLQGAGQ